MAKAPELIVDRLVHARHWFVAASLTGFLLILVVARLGQPYIEATQWRATVGLGNLMAFGSLGLLVGSLVPAERAARWATSLLAIVVALVGILSFWGMVRPL